MFSVYIRPVVGLKVFSYPDMKYIVQREMKCQQGINEFCEVWKTRAYKSLSPDPPLTEPQ